jgi:single-stranded-DNA-specific exonuclease
MSNISRLNALLPFVAIGTVADCQSILEPCNRMLVKAGLKMLQEHKHNNQGLEQLLEQTGLSEKMNQGYQLTSQDLGFTLSPILNSSGRLSHAKLSISTLLADTPVKSKELAEKLIATNQERKQVVKDILKEIESSAKDLVQHGAQVIWLEGNWSKGIVGLLASRLVNQYNLPTIIISKEDEIKASASLRAPEGYHLPQAMSQAGDTIFEKFGGHPSAAGFTAKTDNLPEIRTNLTQLLIQQASQVQLKKTSYKTLAHIPLPDDLAHLSSQKQLIWLQAQDVSEKLISDILLMDPYGQDFSMPQLMIYVDSYAFKWLGSEQKHLKLLLGLEQFPITVFGLKDEIRQEFMNMDYIGNRSLWVQARATQNSWNGNTKKELIAENLWFI